MSRMWTEVIDFNDQYFPNWKKYSLERLGLALGGEAGEVLNGLKHIIGGGTKRMPLDEAQDETITELVDLYIYIVLISERIGFSEADFEIMFKAKMRENLNRMQEAQDHGLH